MLDQVAVELLALLQLRLRQPACAPRLRFLNGPLHRGRQAFEAVFEEVIGCAEVQTPHRLLVADGAGNHDDGHIRSCLLRVRQGGDPVVAGQVVVAEDEIEGFLRQRGFETVLAVDQRGRRRTRPRPPAGDESLRRPEGYPPNGALGVDWACRVAFSDSQL